MRLRASYGSASAAVAPRWTLGVRMAEFDGGHAPGAWSSRRIAEVPTAMLTAGVQ